VTDEQHQEEENENVNENDNDNVSVSNEWHKVGGQYYPPLCAMNLVPLWDKKKANPRLAKTVIWRHLFYTKR